MGQVDKTTLAYREWYAAEPDQFSLFHTPWWLDSVCGPEGWRAISSGGDLTSTAVFMPLTFGKKFYLRGVKKPPLTPFLGPIWQKKVSPRQRLHLIQQLVAAIPGLPFFQTTFRPGEHSALPFLWQKYQLRTRYTFQLTYDGINSPFSYAGRDVSRRLNRVAEHSFRVELSDDMDILFSHVSTVFRRQGSRFGQSRDSWLRTGTNLLARRQGALLVARGKSGHALASQLIGWDAKAIYLLAAGSSDRGRKSDAYYRIVGELSRFLPEGQRTIDYCGSLLPGVAKFNAGFGARAVPYQEIRKTPLLSW